LKLGKALFFPLYNWLT